MGGQPGMNRCYSQELYHHGVKGQQWGVRNGPPYPIEDKILRKGTRINSITGDHAKAETYRKTGRPMYTFNPDDKWDKAVYEGPFSRYLVAYRGKRFLAEHQYEVTKDLRMPTRKERISEFQSLLESKKYKKEMTTMLENYRQQLAAHNMGSTNEMKERIKNLNVNNLKSPRDLETAYEIFGHAMEAAHYNKPTKVYMNNMAKKYDAMVDDNNQGIYNDAHDPVIIFRTHKVLKNVSTKYLTVDDLTKNYDYVKKELEKKGMRVKL